VLRANLRAASKLQNELFAISICENECAAALSEFGSTPQYRRSGMTPIYPRDERVNLYLICLI
jgi:hypothetical protein